MKKQDDVPYEGIKKIVKEFTKKGWTVEFLENVGHSLEECQLKPYWTADAVQYNSGTKTVTVFYL